MQVVFNVRQYFSQVYHITYLFCVLEAVEPVKINIQKFGLNRGTDP